MKLTPFTVVLFGLAGLSACSTPPAAQQAPEPVVASVTQYRHAEINEAASAYVTLYRQTIERSLSDRKYHEALAYRHLSAEACFDSRASRLMDKQISQDEKLALILATVSADQLKAYEGLSRGYVTRVNGLEFLTCEWAGLKVNQKDHKY